jgi:hypothetical protein
MLDHWSFFNAWCLVQGMKPRELAPWDLTDVVEYWLFEGLSDDVAEDLEMKLYQPPATVSDAVLAEDPMWSADAEMDALLKMMG